MHVSPAPCRWTFPILPESSAHWVSPPCFAVHGGAETRVEGQLSTIHQTCPCPDASRVCPCCRRMAWPCAATLQLRPCGRVWPWGMGFSRPGSKHSPHTSSLPFTSLGVSLPASYSGMVNFRLYVLWESQGTGGSVAGEVRSWPCLQPLMWGCSPKTSIFGSKVIQASVSSELVCSHIAQEGTALSQYFLHCIWRRDSSACHCQFST